MVTFTSYASSSAGNLHSITDGATTIMIECGLPWKEVRKHFQFQTSALAGMCCTHAHKDHSRSVADAVRAGIDVFLLPETRTALGISGHRIHEIEPLVSFRVGTFTVKAFPLEHDAPICGFLFASGGEKAVYITDSFYCRWRFSGLSIIAIECNYSKKTLSPDLDPAVRKRLLRSHMSLENAIKFLKANDLSVVREIILIHLSRENSDAEMFQREIQRATGKPVRVAQEG